ncbi:peptidase family M28-domain-containing protein [Podospora appendiculata]|uniref:Peptide hydrolase n=1 Tax=Podospora appendiculata TaxID=314037 RepID=A0AAE0XI02_9PEZI|nr:peptidase family M28-domain-containing protein [Podospora appendiculata]
MPYHRPNGLVRAVRLVLTFTAAAAALAYTPLSDDSLRRIPSGGADFDIDSGALLAPILTPRVPGTAGSRKARQHFVDFFTTQLPGNWTVEWHNSTSTTPATGDALVPFSSLVFRRDPPWAVPGDVGRLTLAAHYDSLYRPEGFVGAVDSAVPCAVLMHVARSVDAALTDKWAAMLAAGAGGDGLDEEKGVQIMLLDGEEAWVSWSDSDSLYGSRALAETWEATRYDVASVFSTPLDAISLFVLLDLLGAPDPHIPSYFANTHWAYQHMAAVEGRLRKLGMLETPLTSQFMEEDWKEAHQFTGGFVLDDHVPFMERGVDILHIIPTPFPVVWHTMDDDGAHLDMPTTRDWARIMAAFVAEWMDLEGFLPALPVGSHEKCDGRGRGEKLEL